MAGIEPTRKPAPFGLFISLKLGNMELGNVDLVPGSKDPKSLVSMKITKLSQTNIVNNTTNVAELANKVINKANGTDTTNLSSIESGRLYSTAEFILNTAADETLEMKILNYIKQNPAQAKVSFRYGFVDGVRSPMYHGYITSMKMSSDFYTVTLVVSWCQGNSPYMIFNQSTLDTICAKEYTKYSDLVTDIATLQGWTIGEITPTMEIDPSSIDYPTANSSPLDYIIQKLVPNAISANGEGGYKAGFKFNLSGEEAFYYKPTTFLVNGYNYRNLKNYNFVIRMLPNGDVISFTPTLVDGLGAASALASGAGEDAKRNAYGIITKDSKEVATITYTINDKANPNALNPDDSTIYATRSNIIMNSPFTDVSKYAEGILKDDINKYAWSTAINASATMQIIGEPDLQLLDYINVVPMYPAYNATSGSRMHPSGGTYQILGIVDEVGSQYTTTLTLVKTNDTKTLSELSGGQPTEESTTQPAEEPKSYQVGDEVMFNGGTHYTNSYSYAKGYNARAGKAKITIINKKECAHPYHLIHTDNTSNVYGWVDEGTFS